MCVILYQSVYQFMLPLGDKRATPWKRCQLIAVMYILKQTSILAHIYNSAQFIVAKSPTV